VTKLLLILMLGGMILDGLASSRPGPPLLIDNSQSPHAALDLRQ
jgi:hypothetical protein